MTPRAQELKLKMIIDLSALVEGLKDRSGVVMMVGFGSGEAIATSSRVGAALGTARSPLSTN